jgi:hypothetical protein
LVPGPGGAIVHVAPGVYSPPEDPACACTVHTEPIGATSTGRVVFISDQQWGAKIMAQSGQTVWLNHSSYVDIVGFELVGASDTEWGILNRAAFVKVIGNHIHDIPVSSCNGTSGSGGGVVHNNDNGSQGSDTIGNLIHHIGPLLADGLAINSYCNDANGIRHNQTGGNIQNNIIHRVATWGIHPYGAATNLNITNNLVFNSGANDGNGGARGGGIMIAGSATTNDNTTVSNNIIRNNRGYAVVEYGSTGTNNTYANNVLFSNFLGVELQNGLTATGSITTDPLMVDFRLDGSGNYRLTTSSPALDQGSTVCASAGPCTPSNDFSGFARPYGTSPDIGPFEWHP